MFRIFRTGDGPPRLVLRFRGGANGQAVWDGRLREGRPAPEGDYAFTVQVRDRAGNPTEAPAPIPSARVARPGTGVSVRPLTLSGPLDVVPAGAVARLQVGPFDRSFDFVLSRYGQTRPIVRGGRIGGLAPGPRAAPDAHRRLPRARPGGRPAGRLAAGGGGPAADARVGRAAAAAHGPPGAHLAGAQPGGQRPRRLRRHAAGGASGAARARASPAAACRRASAPRPRRCCASSTPPGSTTT